MPIGNRIFLPHVSICTMLRVLWRFQIWMKNTKKIQPPESTSKLALGCWPIHLSPVTCQSKGGGRGGTNMIITVGHRGLRR